MTAPHKYAQAKVKRGVRPDYPIEIGNVRTNMAAHAARARELGGMRRFAGVMKAFFRK